MKAPWQRDIEAGRTAHAYYDRALKRWRSELRRILLLPLAVVLPLAIPIWLYLPFGQFYAGLWIGAVAGMTMWMWDDPPEYIAKWKRGADGERQTWKVLRKLEAEGWRGFHDRASERGNIDHIVIGAGGVFLLDSKNLSGEVVLEREGLTTRHDSAERDSFTYTRLGGRMCAAAARLKDRIESETQVRPWVQAVVVIWGNFPQRQTEEGRVVYVAGDDLRCWLMTQKGRLSPRDQRLIELALDAGLVAPPAEPIAPVAPRPIA